MFDKLLERCFEEKVVPPTKRPDGVLVTDTPSPNTIPYRKGLKKGDRVTAAYHDLSGRYERVAGIIYGFTSDDAMILDDASQDFYWIDAKNVFRKK